MEFYFDIEFLRSLLTEKLDEDVFDDFKRFIKHLKNCSCFIFGGNEINQEEFAINPFFQSLVQTLVPEFLSHKDLDIILSQEDSTGFKFFFINHLDVSILKSDYGYYCLSTDDLNIEWKIVAGYRIDLHKYISEKKDPFHFTNWTELKEFQFPINSIIIADRYLFSNEVDLENNLFQLLKNIGLKKLGKRKVDVVVFGKEYFELQKKLRTDRHTDQNPDFKRAFKLLENFLDELIGSENYNLTFLRTDKKTIPIDTKLHYRVLYTNVLFINPGTSFTFFEKPRLSLVPKAGEFITIDHFLNPGTRGKNMEPLGNLKKGFTKIIDEPNVVKVLVHNEKKCKLFN